MGIRQERKERRAKVEKEVKQAIVDSLDYIAERGENWTLRDLRKMMEEKISRDTKLRFKDIIDYEFSRVVDFAEEESKKC